MHLKYILAALVAAALADSARAQQAADAPKPPLFTIYGTFNVNFQTTQAKDATAADSDVKARTAVSTDSTNIGIRGTFDVREALQVVYQCETSANINGATASGICNRNSRVGLSSSKWGTIFFGNWDTPYKAMAYGTKADDPFGSTDVYGFASLLSSPGFNYRGGGWATASTTTTIGFDVRSSSAVAYFSPKWAGLSFKVLYSADTWKNASGTQDPVLYSGVVNFDQGPISVNVSYEQHKDGFGLAGINTAAAPAFGAGAANTAGSATVASHSTDSAARAGAGYQLDWGAGATTVSGMVEQLWYEQSDIADGAVKKYDRLAWQLAAKHRMGNHELRARYSMADQGTCSLEGGADCSTSKYGASDLALGYAYFLAPTAQVYVYGVMIQNDDNAQYTFGTGGSTAAAGVPAVAGGTPRGADPQAVGVGIRYSF